MPTRRQSTTFLYGAATFLCAAGWVFFTGFAYLLSFDVLNNRWWRVGALLVGYLVLAAVTSARAFAALAWFLAGAIAIALCMLAANYVWPLQNERSGGFLSGSGVVNYIFNPWLHVVFYVVLRRMIPLPSQAPPPVEGEF